MTIVLSDGKPIGPVTEPVFYGGEKAYKEENLAKIDKAYGFIDLFLTSTWLAGDELTLADICCASTISSMNELVPINTSLYPNLANWLELVSQQDFYKKGNEPGLAQLRALFKSKTE